jgi:hypothetical protein
MKNPIQPNNELAAHGRWKCESVADADPQRIHRATTLRFYIAAALQILFDNALFISVTWISLQITRSSLLLGMVLCLSVSVPFAFERLFQGGVGRLSTSRLAIVRLLIFTALIMVVQLGGAKHVAGFLSIALATGMVDYFTMNALEAENAKLSLAGVSSNEAVAKWLQTAIQAGSFLGALLGGTLLGYVSNSVLISSIGVMAGIAAFLLPSTRSRASAQESGHNSDTRASMPQSIRTTFEMRQILPQLLCLGSIGFHNGAFNTLVPLVYERLHGWEPGIFGIVGGLAGIGALLAAVLPTVRVSAAVFAIVIIVVDALVVASPYPALSAVAALALGFSINHVRISIRTHLIETTRTNTDAEWIGSHTAFYFLSFQAAAPLLFTALASTALLGNARAPGMMIAAGCLLCGATLSACRRLRSVPFGANGIS